MPISVLCSELLDRIFEQVELLGQGKRRVGYTYEYDSEDDDSEDEDYYDSTENVEEDSYAIFSNSTKDNGWMSVYEELGGYEFNFSIDDWQFYPKYHLRPLLLVCKTWYPIAEHRLYRSISVGSDTDDGCHFIGGADKAIAVADTLRDSPRLAGCVRELRLGSMEAAKSETQAHAELIKCCKNLTSFYIEGYNGCVLHEVLENLAKVRGLRSLRVSRHTLRDWECDTFCSLDELFEMMMNWPDLENVLFHNTTIGHCLVDWYNAGFDSNDSEEDNVEKDQDQDDPWAIRRRELLEQMRQEEARLKPIRAALKEKILSPPAGCCPSLREFVLLECVHLHPEHVRALRLMAPFLTNFSARSTDSAFPELIKAIQTWAPTLEDLNLKGEPVAPLLDDVLCSQLVELRSLRSNTRIIAASSIQALKKLEKLVLHVYVSDEIEQLAADIREGLIPSLGKMLIWTAGGGKVSKKAADRLNEACRAKGVAVHCEGH